MAEVLGVMASGIAVAQIAGQITSSIIKLKGFWSQIKEAPIEINHLLREIDSLNLMLQHMQDDRSQQPLRQLSAHNLCVQKSLELCKECAAELSALVNDLAMKVQGKNGWRKKMGSAKVVLSKDDIKSLKRRLKTAIGMLSLSYQFHTSAMIQLQPELIVMRVADHLTTLKRLEHVPELGKTSQAEKLPNARSKNLITQQYNIWTSSAKWIRLLLGQFEYRYGRNEQQGKYREILYTSYKFPQLLSYYQVAVWGIHPLSGWWFTFDCHRTISENDLFFTAIENGDLSIVQELLATKKAFVTDRSDRNDNPTALHIAAEVNNPEMCRLLLNEGSNLLAMDNDFKTPFHRAVKYGSLSSLICTGTGKALDTYRVLVTAGADELLINNPEVLMLFNGPLSAFAYLQQQMYPPFYTISPESRLILATRYASKKRGWHNSPYLVQKMLTIDGAIDHKLLGLASQDGQELFHCIVGWWAAVYFSSLQSPGRRLYDNKDEKLDSQLPEKLQDLPPSMWATLACKSLICSIISTRFSIQRLDSSGQTLFARLFSDFRVNDKVPNDRGTARTIECMVCMMVEWLSILLECGIDLEDYGRWEKTHIRSKDKRLNYNYWDVDTWNLDKIHFDLINFAYGPRPEDWKFWFSEPSDPFAGDFWAMVEEGIPWIDREPADNHQEPMPGSWSEDF